MSVQFELPDDIDVAEVKMYIAAKLFDDGKLTSGQAAEIAGITKRKFIETVGKYGVSIFQYTPEEFLEDVKNA